MGANDSVNSILKLSSMVEGKREYTRLPIHADARILTNGDAVEGMVENLSIKGAFVMLASQMKINDLVTVTMSDAISSQIIKDLKARVVRVSDNGVGLQFEKTILV